MTRTILRRRPITVTLDSDVEQALRIALVKDKRWRYIGELISDLLRKHPAIKAELNGKEKR